MSHPATLELEADAPPFTEPSVPAAQPVAQPEPPDRAGVFVRLPTIRTLTARVEVVGRLKPLPLPDLDD